MSNRNRRRNDVAGDFDRDRDDELVLDVERVIVRADQVIIRSDNIIIKSDNDRRRNNFDDVAGVEDSDDRRNKPSRPFLNF